jgi:hypothetical protein
VKAGVSIMVSVFYNYPLQKKYVFKAATKFGIVPEVNSGGKYDY